MLHPEYVIEHTQKVKGKNRYNLFNPSETKTNKRKKRDEAGIDITNEPMGRRKRKPQDDDDEIYNPLMSRGRRGMRKGLTECPLLIHIL